MRFYSDSIYIVVAVENSLKKSAMLWNVNPVLTKDHLYQCEAKLIEYEFLQWHGELNGLTTQYKKLKTNQKITLVNICIVETHFLPFFCKS